MNDPSHLPPIDPELEARIVAFVLGEASDFEREQLVSLIEERPELKAFRNEMELLHGLMHGAASQEPDPGGADWQLPNQKRAAVLDVIEGTAASDDAVVFRPVSRSWFLEPRTIRKFCAVAAAVLIVGCMGTFAYMSVREPFAMHAGADMSVALDSVAIDKDAVTAESLGITERQSAAFLAASDEFNFKEHDWAPPMMSNSREERLSEIPSNRPDHLDSSVVAGDAITMDSRRRPQEVWQGLDEESAGGFAGGALSDDDVDAKDMSMFGGRALGSRVYGDQDQYFDDEIELGVMEEMSLGMEPAAERQSKVSEGDQRALYFGRSSRDKSSAVPQRQIQIGQSGRLAGGGEEDFGVSENGNGSNGRGDNGLLRFSVPQIAEAGKPVQTRGLRVQSEDRFYSGADANLRRDWMYDDTPNASLQDSLGRSLEGKAEASKKIAEAKADSRFDFRAGQPIDEFGIVLRDRKSLGFEIEELETDGIASIEISDEAVKQDVVAAGIVPTRLPSSGLVDMRAAKQRELLRRSRSPIDLNEKIAANEPFSTFSLHVSDVSFKLARNALANGQWPDAEKVRVEEFVNAFNYGDPMPTRDEKVACQIEQSIHPFVQQRNLLRISMRTAAAGRAAETPLRLTCLLDNSGSMERLDRQETVRRAFALLAGQLKPIDEITLISFARQPRLLADKVAGDQADGLVALIDELPSEGGTNLEAALQLAFEKASERRSDNAQSRIVLLTDGAVNLGDADPGNLSRMITSIRDSGIAFDAAGIIADGLNDEVLESMTRQGDGRYYLLDSIESTDDSFVKQIAGALRPSAKNVKVQVEFNSNRVGRYRLLGFEKHRLNREDFRNDAVDAAEMAAEEAGVAVYEFEAMSDGEGDVGSVSVRFQDLSTGRMIENRWPIPYQADTPRLAESRSSMQIAASAALLATKLRGEPQAETVELSDLYQMISSLPERSRQSSRVGELQQMIQQAQQLER
ncbi:vWA domain-containing protein [Rhodopirellula sp. SWK7]|uniref:vWA domain-containing protein n=1 Tax=Rhodopirellula sp. SWK7 TaxID=595460 RepID=UPI0002BE5509|nr:von Willebrand factor type A domain-containing protein [Rhodopirellula sp. SWK7]EMI43386.1 von Willebrand factor type A domain protein [Rhodopirellula sp. SWK7]